MEKKFNFKKFLSNNAIIILIILLALFVGSVSVYKRQMKE